MSNPSALPKEEKRALDFVDEIQFRLSRQRAIARMLGTIFEILDRPESTTGTGIDVASLWEGLRVIAGDIDEDLVRVDREVRKLHQFAIGGGR